MANDKDPYTSFNDDTLRRAEEMCKELGSGLSLDRRGQSQVFQGALTDIDDSGERRLAVLVVEQSDQPWVMMIADQPLERCRNALLVFRTGPGQDMKFLGRHDASRPGQRSGDEGKHVCRFEILRDVRERG